LLFAPALVSMSQVLAAELSMARMRTPVIEAVQDVGAKMKVGVGPAITEELVASAVIFAGNFCHSQERRAGEARCNATLFAPAVLRRHVKDFLMDSQAGHSEVMPLGARLAREVGGDFSQIGWPSLVSNAVGVVQLPVDRSVSEVSLATATGMVRVSGPAKQLLLSGGRHQIAVKYSDGGTGIGPVSVLPKKRVVFMPSANAGQGGFGRLDPPPDLFCYDRLPGKGTTAPNGPLAMFNWGRARIVDPAENHLAPLASKFGVEVNVEDRFERCNVQCREAIGIAFAQAIAVWRTGCARCDANALSLIRVGGMVWMDARLAERLRRKISGQPVSLDLSQRDADEMGRVVMAPSLSVPQMSVVGYEQVSSDPALISPLCRMADSASWLPVGKHFLCGAGVAQPTTGVVSALLRLLGDTTQCGPGKEFVACGLPNAGIELALGVTRFTLPTRHGGLVIGASTDTLVVPMQDVILHEVGHWFGVPHFEEIGVMDGADIMASTLGDGSACVSSASLTMMNNALDTRWRWRVLEGRGLRRPVPKTDTSSTAKPRPTNSSDRRTR